MKYNDKIENKTRPPDQNPVADPEHQQQAELGLSVPAKPSSVAASHLPCCNSEAKAGASAVTSEGFGLPPTANEPLTDYNRPLITATTPDDLRDLRASVVNLEKQNRTFPDETPPGSKNEPLKINDFHNPDLNGRPVFNSENGHTNDDGHSHKNGHPNANGNNAVLRDPVSLPLPNTRPNYNCSRRPFGVTLRERKANL